MGCKPRRRRRRPPPKVRARSQTSGPPETPSSVFSRALHSEAVQGYVRRAVFAAKAKSDRNDACAPRVQGVGFQVFYHNMLIHQHLATGQFGPLNIYDWSNRYLLASLLTSPRGGGAFVDFNQLERFWNSCDRLPTCKLDERSASSPYSQCSASPFENTFKI